MTYSLVVRDTDADLLGIATQSHAFAVGSTVPWTAPGWGVIATQSVGEPFYGELGLDLLAGGLDANEALVALRSIDSHPERRQVAMLDAAGTLAVYTGEACVAAAGHLVGPDWCVLANMVASSSVWEAMAASIESSRGRPLADRLVAALDAGEEHGGDIRGRRSAALTVVRATRTGRPWEDREVDLRVDDHETPVRELQRLVVESQRYHRAVGAFEATIDGRPDEAVERLDRLAEDGPVTTDVVLWRTFALAVAGREEEAHASLAEAAAGDGSLVDTFRRYASAAPEAAEVIERVADRTPVDDGERPRPG